MAGNRFDEEFGIRPVPKRHKNGGFRKLDTDKADRRKAHYSTPDRICLYIISTASAAVSKVGVSRDPYNRVVAVGNELGQELRLCFFIELSRADGYALETEYHRRMREAGFTVTGEWVDIPRPVIAKQIRLLVREMGLEVFKEVGDPCETETGEGASGPFAAAKGWQTPAEKRCRKIR